MSVALTVPTGSAIAAASATGTATNFQPSPAAATRAIEAAKIRNVRWVPANGTNTRAESSVPSREPAVEIA